MIRLWSINATTGYNLISKPQTLGTLIKCLYFDLLLRGISILCIPFIYSTDPLIRTLKGQTFLFELRKFELIKIEVKLGFLGNTKETSLSLFKTFISYLKSP